VHEGERDGESSVCESVKKKQENWRKFFDTRTWKTQQMQKTTRVVAHLYEQTQQSASAKGGLNE